MQSPEDDEKQRAEAEQRKQRREELLRELRPGEIRHGVVSQIMNFGAFVDLGGVVGLVHLSQLGWDRVNHPDEAVRVGQEVDVQVLSVDIEKRKVALSIKRATSAPPDPWLAVAEQFTPDQIVIGVVTKLSAYGAFVAVEGGAEGLFYLAGADTHADLAASLHDHVPLSWRVLRIDMEHRRLILTSL
jgi:small subunit ribosomal protein S1